VPILTPNHSPGAAMRRNRNAKIVATLGPASSSPEMIRALFDAGADVFRLNFSHGTHDDHRRRFEAIRAIEHEVGRPIGILQDLQGPKIRIGTLKSGQTKLLPDSTVRFHLSSEPGDAKDVPLPHPEVVRNILPGHMLMIDDGKLRLRVTQCGDDYFEACVLVGGMLSDRKGVNLPNTNLPLSPLTEKDRIDLNFGLSLGVDWIALSFVQRPMDIIEAQGLVKNRAGIMAKIEKPAALECIEDIVRLADAVMVARGDLGVEIPPEDVPGTQKELIRLCRRVGKPIIVATQMLESMIQIPSPTRAEASDVATAIYDSADAVMLSAESASGQFPLEAVAMMDRIISHTENHKLYRSIIDALQPAPEDSIPHAVAAAAADVADHIGAAAIVAFTASGTTALRVARKRPKVPIISLSPEAVTARQLALLWGVHSIVAEDIGSYDEMVERARTQVLSQGVAEPGDSIVIVAGMPFGRPGTTNNLRVMRL
jgi:pyruvate kinase